MAVVTVASGTYLGQPWSFEANYNANNGRVQNLTCVNQSAATIWGQVRDLMDGDVFERIFPPNATTQQAVPAGAIVVQVRIDPEFPDSPELVQRDILGELQPLPIAIRVPA